MQHRSEIFQFFLAEHDALEGMFEQLVSRILRYGMWDEGIIRDTEDFIFYLQTTYEQHLIDEEKLLFPAMLEILGNANQPLILLQEEHQEIRNVTNKFIKEFKICLQEMKNSDALLRFAWELYDVVHEHMYKESSFLYPMAEKLLSRSVKDGLIHKRNYKSYL